MANGIRHPGSIGVGRRSRVVQDYDKRPSQHESPWWSGESLYGPQQAGPPGTVGLPPGVRPPSSPVEQTGPPGTPERIGWEREAMLLELLMEMGVAEDPERYGMGEKYKNPLWRELMPGYSINPLRPYSPSGHTLDPDQRYLRSLRERLTGNQQRAAGALEGSTLDPGMKSIVEWLARRERERARPLSEADYMDPRYESRRHPHPEGSPRGPVEMPRVPVDPGFFSNMPMVPYPGWRGRPEFVGMV